MTAQQHFDKIGESLGRSHSATTGQMFGKKCIKVGNKACIALYNEDIVFKIPREEVEELLALEGSVLWDPSGKGRAMKEWIQIPNAHSNQYIKLAKTSAEYIS